MNFHQYSKEIVTEYLGTVAYVDDLIFSERKEVIPTNKTEIVTPTRRSVAEALTNRVESESTNPAQQLRPNIEPKTFINAFLKKKIQCSLFEITNDDDSLEDLINILCKSDVVILDWQMHQDNGRKAKELLQSVLSKSKEPELRLFIIYTDANNFKVLLEESIIPELLKINIDGRLDDTGCIYKFGHSKIIVIEKANGNISENSTTDEELPDRIIDEFTHITLGLVSNTVLASLSAIRRNIHQLLGIFNSKLDSAFLSHRALLPNPIDAEEHLLDLIGSELKNIIHKEKCNEPVSLDIIKNYINEHYPDEEFDFLFPNKTEFETIELPEKIKKDLLISFINSGIEKVFLSKNTPTLDKLRFSENCFQRLTEQFCLDNELAQESNYKFALLTTNKNIYNSHNLPKLSLGTILKFESPTIMEYWLCIQPKCDSVRIERNREFLMAKLNILDETKNSNIITIHKNSILHFEIEYSIYKTKFFKFKANFHQSVQAEIIDERIIFIGDKNMEWISTLKDDFAQEISNKFGATLSRVGTNPSEWLRRS